MDQFLDKINLSQCLVDLNLLEKERLMALQHMRVVQHRCKKVYDNNLPKLDLSMSDLT